MDRATRAPAWCSEDTVNDPFKDKEVITNKEGNLYSNFQTNGNILKEEQGKARTIRFTKGQGRCKATIYTLTKVNKFIRVRNFHISNNYFFRQSTSRSSEVRPRRSRDGINRWRRQWRRRRGAVQGTNTHVSKCQQ